MNRSDVRIGILVPEGRDRTLLRDLVRAEGWEPAFPADGPDADGPWRDIDTIVVDGASLERYRRGIERTRHRAGSEFVPVLLLSRRDLAAGTRPAVCDQVLTYPTTRAEFTARLRGLVRARIESRRVYRSFLENALIGVYRATWSGEILMANDALARMLGTESVEDLKARGLRIPELASDSEFRREIRDAGQAEGVETLWTRAEGSPLHVIHSARRIDGSGVAGGVDEEQALVEGTVENVTDLVDSRERLARSERFLQSAIDALSAHVAILDPEGRIVSTNQAWRRFESDARPPDASDVGVNYLAVCNGAQDAAADEVADGIRRVIDGEIEVFEMEYPCHSPTEHRWFRMVVTGFPEPPPRRAVVAHENITEIKVAQKRFQLLIEGSREMTVVVDEGGSVTYRSPSTIEFLGHDDLEGLPFVDMVHPQDRDAVRGVLSDPRGGPTFECRIRHADAPWREVEWSTSDMRGDSIVRGIVLHGRDVTERKEMLGELQAREKEVRQMQKMEAVGMLAGGVAHDFNNLLTTIQGNVSLLQEKLGESGDAEASALVDQLEEIAQAARQGAFLTRRLLVFSRREPEVEPTVEDLNEVLRGLGRMLKRLVVETIDVRLDISEGALPVRIRAGEVEQVVVNLVINAAQAMPGDGEIVIRSRAVRVTDDEGSPPEARTLPPEHHRLEPGEYAVLEVVDTGHGMPPEVQERIFEPFFTTKPRGEGTGLGLATVFGIVSRGGGSIEVYSEVGLGSRFAVRLPLAEEATAPVETPAMPDAEEIRGGETLLLVEDEEPVRRTARRGLERLGYTVLEARHGAEAVEVLDSPAGEAVAAIVSDFVMPEMSGLELARHVHERGRGIPVLITSGYPDAELDFPPGLRWDTLSKPYALADLGARVRELLGGGEDA